MKPAAHSTNYADTLIAVADDCPTAVAEAPPAGGRPTLARRQYELLHAAPYRYTSDELLLAVMAERLGAAQARAQWAAKPQACLRASALPKRYGWGLHHDAHRRVALVARESEAYAALAADPNTRCVKAMRSRRA